MATGYTLALAAVIPLSGWLADRFGTKRLYMISITLFLCGSALPEQGQRLDFVDFLLLSPGLALVIYGLAETNAAGGFASAKVLVPLVAGLVLLGAFVWHPLRARDPLIDLRLFKDRTFATSSTMLVLVAVSVFGTFLLLPLYFQVVRGESALQSGLLLAPQGFGAMLAMPPRRPSR